MGKMHNSHLRIGDDRGITIVEVLVASVILVLVLGIAYSLYFFGTTAFTRGESQAIVQQEVRQAARVIAEQVRFAYELDALSSLPDPLTFDDDEYVVFDDVNGEIRHYTSSNPTGSKLAEANLVVFTVDGSSLTYVIQAGHGEKTFSMTSEVRALNYERGTDGVDKPAIRFRNTRP